MNTDKTEEVVRHLVKEYARSVKKCEFEDLCQTVWYLVLLSAKKYDPSKGKSIEAYAYYFANMKLKDHFHRRVKLPETDGTFSLLQIKADMVDDTENLPDTAEYEDKFYSMPDEVKLHFEGYNLDEIATILKTSKRKVRRAITEFKKEITS